MSLYSRNAGVLTSRNFVTHTHTHTNTHTGIKTPALIPELDDPEFVDATNFFVRDMPYSWDVLVENLYKF